MWYPILQAQQVNRKSQHPEEMEHRFWDRLRRRKEMASL